MRRQPTRANRTDTLFPFTTLVRSEIDEGACAMALRHRLPALGVDVDHGGQLGAGQPREFVGVILAEMADADYRGTNRSRSEEHTSELQSLMRIPYAVFCLKKKTTTKKLKSSNHRLTCYHVYN